MPASRILVLEYISSLDVIRDTAHLLPGITHERLDNMPSGDNTQDVFKIAAFSGFTGDNWRALKQQASQAPVLFGDYLAEMVSLRSMQR